MLKEVKNIFPFLVAFACCRSCFLHVHHCIVSFINVNKRRLFVGLLELENELILIFAKHGFQVLVNAFVKWAAGVRAACCLGMKFAHEMADLRVCFEQWLFLQVIAQLKLLDLASQLFVSSLSKLSFIGIFLGV